MQCPQDQTVLQMTERQGVEIDYCPTCRGVWLDRGELDKIIDRAGPTPASPPPGDPGAYQPSHDPRTESVGLPPAPYQQPPYQQPPYQDPRYQQQYGRPRYPSSPDSPDERHGYDIRYGQDQRHGGKRHRKESFLGNLFDF
ncbi:MAG TPA: zf-TFIIB domain-containing protein [Propionibacteriaceae bacterium]